MPAGGEIEVPVAIDGGECAGDIELHDLHPDADIARDCWMKVARSGMSSPMMIGHDLEGEAIAVGAALVTGLVEQGLGLLLVEG